MHTMLNALCLSLLSTKLVLMKFFRNIVLKNNVKMQDTDGILEVKTLLKDVKENGIENGRLRLEDISLLTIVKEDTFLMQPLC